MYTKHNFTTLALFWTCVWKWWKNEHHYIIFLNHLLYFPTTNNKKTTVGVQRQKELSPSPPEGWERIMLWLISVLKGSGRNRAGKGQREERCQGCQPLSLVCEWPKLWSTGCCIPNIASGVLGFVPNPLGNSIALGSLFLFASVPNVLSFSQTAVQFVFSIYTEYL